MPALAGVGETGAVAPPGGRTSSRGCGMEGSNVAEAVEAMRERSDGSPVLLRGPFRPRRGPDRAAWPDARRRGGSPAPRVAGPGLLLLCARGPSVPTQARGVARDPQTRRRIGSCKSLESFYNSAPPVKIQVDAGYLRCWRGVTVPGFRSPGELRR